MSCYLSTSCFGNTHVADAIAYCHSLAPFRVEISAPHHYMSMDKLKVLLSSYKREGYKMTIHNYFPSPKKSFVLNNASSIDYEIEQTKKLVRNALELAEVCGSPLYGIHAGYLSSASEQKDGIFKFEGERNSYSRALDSSIRFVNSISKEFEQTGVRLLIENLFPSPSTQNSLFCTLNEISEFISQVPKSVGLLLDLGHLNVSSNLLNFSKTVFIEKYLEDFGDRLLEVHISENKGSKDDHLPIQTGSWQLDFIKEISRLSKPYDQDRVFCIETRNASTEQISRSLDLVNQIIN